MSGPAVSAGTSILRGLTTAEFYALPDSDEYRHSELIDGEVLVNPPSLLHQRILQIDPEPLGAQILRRSPEGHEYELAGELDGSGRLESPLLPDLSIPLESLIRR